MARHKPQPKRALEEEAWHIRLRAVADTIQALVRYGDPRDAVRPIIEEHREALAKELDLPELILAMIVDTTLSNPDLTPKTLWRLEEWLANHDVNTWALSESIKDREGSHVS